MDCFKYQWAEVISQEYRLFSRALPIIRYALDENGSIEAVQLNVTNGSYQWFNRADVILYRADYKFRKAHEIIHSNKSETFKLSLLKRLGLKRF